jgi:hypothetical protein
VDKYGFPLAINVSPANVHDSKGIVPVLHQLAGFKGTALGDLSYRGQRLSKRRSASPSNPAPTAGPSFRRGFAGWSTSFSAGTAESLSLLIPYPRAGHAALLNVVHWLERRRDREPLAGPNDVVATAGFAAAQGDDPPRPADPTLSCRPPTDRIEGGRP